MAGYSNPELASQWEHVTPQCEEALRTEDLGWLHQPLTKTSPCIIHWYQTIQLRQLPHLFKFQNVTQRHNFKFPSTCLIFGH